MPALTVDNLLTWVLQTTGIIVSAAVLARLLRVDTAGVRHAWWRAVLVLCLALPLLQPWPHATAAPGPVATAEAPRPAALAMPTGGTDLSASPADRPRPDLLTPIVGFALAIGAALRLGWVALGLYRLRSLRMAGTSVAPTDSFQELRALVGCDAEVRCVETLGQPVTFGLRRPVVLLPASLGALPADVQRAVLAHELWHVHRRDWPWTVAEEILRGVLWFHPGVWWLISRVQSSREEAVDELTVLLTHSRRSYLEALLAFADRPLIPAASPYAQLRHLSTRMLCVSKEAVMSPRRIVLSSAGLLAGVALAGWYVTAAVPLTAAPLSAATRVQLPPRDARPGQPRPPSAREAELQKQLALDSENAGAWLELARLQEGRRAVAEAEATLLAMRSALPGRPESYRALAGLQHRTGHFDSAIDTLEQAASLSPADPTGYQILATFFYEKGTRDATLVPVEKMSYLRQGLTAADRALAASPDYVDALIYKGLLLRTLAGLEPDTAERRTLLKEADSLRARALALRESTPARAGAGSPVPGAPPPPPPPPPPPAPVDPDAPLDSVGPLRVGGSIKTPTKIRDVRPVYPPEALAAGIQGVVILEAVIDQGGGVSNVRVLRSIPLLDQAAVDAVREWQFTPTLLNGVPVPVTMTMTVNFTQQ